MPGMSKPLANGVDTNFQNDRTKRQTNDEDDEITCAKRSCNEVSFNSIRNKIHLSLYCIKIILLSYLKYQTFLLYAVTRGSAKNL